MNRKGEYERLYNYDMEDSRNYEEFVDSEEIIDSLRGTVGRGDCLYCGATDAMEYEGHICFICNVCGKSVHEDIYYQWLAGHPIFFDE